MRLLISGGLGSGCTSTARSLGVQLNLPVFDSDMYFHKPTDPPFQQQYTPEERRTILEAALGAQSSWILSGSVALWQVRSFEPTHGVFLQIPRQTRLERLALRQESQFGSRILAGGDLQAEHQSFMNWAVGYENRTEEGRNLVTDRTFLESRRKKHLVLTEAESMDRVISRIVHFLTDSK